MEALIVYVPMDRRHALLEARALPDRTEGAALFADISGFTPLTEALVRALGPLRGAEELTRYLNLVYDALIDEVHRFGGSAIAFAGDAVTCWFDGDDGRLATACALSMQRAMAQAARVTTPAGETIHLSMKVAVAAGRARRFLVGDPTLRVIDAVAGETLVRLANAEHHAQRGEVVLDQHTWQQLAERVVLQETRAAEAEGERYGVVEALTQEVRPIPWPSLPLEQIEVDQLRPWLLRPVYERLSRGLGEFLAELRPTVALFLRFEGIDYDGDDEAGAKLDAYIRWIQRIVDRYDGTLVDLNIGDKGSYLYINFGAPLAHENDAVLAAQTALALRALPAELSFIHSVQMGISQGRMRAGAYGGAAHRTYGVLGDEVNMAARLMMKAQPGQIVVSEATQARLADGFHLERLAPMGVKGKQGMVTAYLLRGARQTPHVGANIYALPMVGREEELQQSEARLARAEQGDGQIISLVGEPGVGKTRLVAEIVASAQARGWTVYAGACEAQGVINSYLVWHPIWRSIFGMDVTQPVPAQIDALARALAALDERLLPRLPLLDALFDLAIPDTALTRSLDPKVRKSALEALLVEVLRRVTRQSPTLIVLEDCHWLDPLSYDLLITIGAATDDRPVCLVVAHRELALEWQRTGTLSALPHHTRLVLREFTPQESSQLLALKLAQMKGERVALPERLVARLIEQAQGNPFYLEELVAYLHYQQQEADRSSVGSSFELPDSLHRLVLSRLDQLTERQKITVKIASIIGRVFRAAWLAGVYPSLGDNARVVDDLERLRQKELTLREHDAPELTYLFKQVITQNVVYESLPHALRTTIHEQMGYFLERSYAETREQYLDLLAYHFDRSENEQKQRVYLRLAGEAAQTQYSNLAAVAYYRRLLELLPVDERLDVQLQLGQVLELMGEWVAAREVYEQALSQRLTRDDDHGVARVESAMGELLRKQGVYADAATRLARAREVFESLDDLVGLGQVLHIGGTVAAQQGDYEKAQTLYEESLAIRRQLDDQDNEARLLSNLGILARFRDDYEAAQSFYEQSLALRRALQDPWAIANSLNNLGMVARYKQEYDTARALLAESLAISREVGDPWATANILSSLAEVTLDQEDFEAAAGFLTESLDLNRRLGAKRSIAFLLESFSVLAVAQAQPERAFILAGGAAALREAINAPLSPTEAANLEANLDRAREALGAATEQSATERGRTVPLDDLLDAILGAARPST